MAKTKKEPGGAAGHMPVPPGSAPGSNALEIEHVAGEDDGLTLARARLHPVINATCTTRHFKADLVESSIGDLAKELSKHVNDVKAGNMNRPEAILMTQAHTLDVVFNALAQRAGANIGSNLDRAEIYLRMALRAQAQCRTTLEALAEIKAPKSATFIKQANIAGQQQVNNGGPASHEKNITPSNELLSESSHATLDIGGAGAAIGTDSQLEAMGAIYRPAERRREGAQ